MGIRGQGKFTTRAARKSNDKFLEKFEAHQSTFKQADVIQVVTKGCGTFPGLIVARIAVMSGETVYSVAVTRYGGLWIKGDWVIDTYWNPIGDKALEQDYPSTMAEILSKLPAIKAWQASLQ